MPSVLRACFNRLTHLISCIFHALLPLYLYKSVCACNNQLRTQSVAIPRNVRVPRLSRALQTMHLGNREVGRARFFSLRGSLSLLPKPSAWTSPLHLWYSAVCEVRSSQCATSDEFQSNLWQRGVRSKPLRQKLSEIVPRF